MSRQSIYREAETVKRALDLLEAGTPMCVFDLETTGLNRVTDRILSCSALKVVKEGGVLVEKERMDIFLNPGFPIPKAASDINHITDEVVAGCELEDTAAYKIRQFFGEKPLVQDLRRRICQRYVYQGVWRKLYATSTSGCISDG